MTYTVRPIDEEKTWESFVLEQNPHSFLHSWTWGEQHAEEGPVFRLGIYRGESLAGVALFFQVTARRGRFLFCPHGPVIGHGEDGPELLKELCAYTTALAKREKCDFIRISPLLPDTKEWRQEFKRNGFRPAPIHMHPELAWMLDLSPDESALLAAMRKTTRYLIRKSEKESDLEIFSSNTTQDIEQFWPVYLETVKRQNFTPFSKAYLRREFDLFAKHGQVEFFFAKYRGTVVSAAIIVFYGHSAFYHHSGSIQQEKLNTSYLLQWRVIQEAKRRGCQLYNFWGIAPEDRPKHPWAGLSLFKKGFGGYAEAYVHAQDKPLTAKYWVNYLVETIRRIKRGV